MSEKIPHSLIQTTESYIRDEFYGEGTGHDWFHIDRVRRSALQIALEEKGDPGMVELIALLHDLGDRKLHHGDENAAPRLIRSFLDSQGLESHLTEHIIHEIVSISYKGESGETKPGTLEGLIVQDADRLDAIGAIGIARAFAYGGARDRLLYDPSDPPRTGMDAEAYKNHKSHTVNHFYEKLLLLHQRMNTATAQRMASDRHRFMEEYLAQFFDEWNGRA